MALKRLTLIRGDSRDITVTFTNSAEVPFCLKNWTVFFTMKTHWDLPDAEASLQKIVTSFDDSIAGTSGVAVISLAPEDTVNLPPQEYDYDIAVTTAAGKNYTVLRGKVDLQYEVTRTAGTAGTAA